MLTYQSAFEQELKKEVQAKIDFLTAFVTNPHAIEDYPHYREQAGRLASFRMIDELCEAANETLRKRERGE